jgi:hypothetical protein
LQGQRGRGSVPRFQSIELYFLFLFFFDGEESEYHQKLCTVSRKTTRADGKSSGRRVTQHQQISRARGRNRCSRRLGQGEHIQPIELLSPRYAWLLFGETQYPACLHARAHDLGGSCSGRAWYRGYLNRKRRNNTSKTSGERAGSSASASEQHTSGASPPAIRHSTARVGVGPAPTQDRKRIS